MADDEKTDLTPDFYVHILGPHESGGTIQIDATPSGGLRFSIPTKTMGLIQLVAGTVGWESVAAILAVGAALQKRSADAGGDLTADSGRKLKELNRTPYQAAKLVTREQILEASYELLREHKISRAQAADLATDVLQKQINTEAWRKAVDKWASDHGKPPVELPRGRPAKIKPEPSL